MNYTQGRGEQTKEAACETEQTSDLKDKNSRQPLEIQNNQINKRNMLQKVKEGLMTMPH